MQYYFAQALAFFLVYWVTYTLGVLACRGVNHLLKRPLQLTPHAAGVALVYAVAVFYVLVFLYVMIFSPADYQLSSFSALFQSVPAMLGAIGAFAVALVPCVLFILTLNIIEVRKAKKLKQKNQT